MKNSAPFASNLAMILWLVVSPQPVAAKSHNPQPVSWFTANLSGKDPINNAFQAKSIGQDTLPDNKSKEQALAAMYEQAQKYAAEGSLEMAVITYEGLLRQSANYKDADAKLQPVREQLEQKQLNDKLESEYAMGRALLKAQDWTRAIITFEEVLKWDPNFRDARRRLNEAKRGLEKESTEIVTARYYANGVALMNQNDLGRALAAFEKVRNINPNYRNAAVLEAEIERMLGQKSPGGEIATVSNASLDSLYQGGLAAEQKGDWIKAVVAFEKLQVLQPDYRDVDERLIQARRRLNQLGILSAPTTRVNPWPSPLYVGSAMLGLAFIPLLGFVIFSPSVRARYHLIRGRYAEAVKIYERRLARKPDKVKLYPALANLYLLMGRHDERALKVYKMVLQLNLATTNRDEITATVGQHYLSEGRTDSDAIDVLESLLKSEKRKHIINERQTNA